MSPASVCRCPLCRIERNLLARFSDSRDQEVFRIFVSSTRNLSTFQDVPALLTHLRASQGDPRTDEIFLELLEAVFGLPELIEGIFVLAFVPVIHRTLRHVTALQPLIPLEDGTQEALRALLQVLRSEQFRLRQTHIAFAIARTIKRNVFAWASREGMVVAIDQEISEDTLLVSEEELFERHAVLRHFLHRCLAKGLLADDELDLLLQFKLDGDRGEDLGGSEGISANAFRQRAKRLLGKLRRLAQRPPSTLEPDGEGSSPMGTTQKKLRNL
jgi:hypothetical protein